MIQPDPLQKGDKVAIVAPAKAFNAEDIEKAIALFEKWGLEVSLSRHLFASYHQFAGKDQQRTKDFQQAINDPKIKAIFCVRGGYGTTRIIDDLDFNPFRDHPKWVIGFSDITALHCHLNNLNYESIHGIMPTQFGKRGAKAAVESLRKILFGETISYYSKPKTFNRKGEAKGKLIGGNLSMLCHVIGTASDFETKDCILVIEDIDEYKYRIDRMMVQLKRAGKLNKIRALIAGHFTDIKDGKEKFGKTVEEIILDHVKEFKFPVCFGFPSGHHVANMALPMGRVCKLNVDKLGGVLEIKR